MSLRHDTRTDALRRLPLLARVPRRHLDRVQSLSTPVTFAPGDRIVGQGQLGREAFVILAGIAEVLRDGDHLAQVGPGDVVGELALLGEGRRTASVVATTNVRALVMSPREFTSLLALPGVGEAVRRTAVERAA